MVRSKSSSTGSRPDTSFSVARAFSASRCSAVRRRYVSHSACSRRNLSCHSWASAFAAATCSLSVGFASTGSPSRAASASATMRSASLPAAGPFGSAAAAVAPGSEEGAEEPVPVSA